MELALAAPVKSGGGTAVVTGVTTGVAGMETGEVGTMTGGRTGVVVLAKGVGMMGVVVLAMGGGMMRVVWMGLTMVHGHCVGIQC